MSADTTIRLSELRNIVAIKEHPELPQMSMVTVVVNGSKQLQSLRIDPEVVSKDDVEMLQDLILAAVNDAHRKVDEQLGQSMSGLLGGLKIPGLF